MTNYQNLSEAFSDLRERGFVTSFFIQKDQLHCSELERDVNPEEVRVVEKYHVADPGNVTGERDILAVETKDNVKGIMLNTYEEYDKEEYDNIVKRFQWIPTK